MLQKHQRVSACVAVLTCLRCWLPGRRLRLLRVLSSKTHRICEEFIGYTSRDIEIFITAYEIAASIAKQSREYRAHTSERPKNRLFCA